MHSRESVIFSVVEALSAYPEQALERVRDYGTKLEIYDFAGGDQVPDYLPTVYAALKVSHSPE